MKGVNWKIIEVKTLEFILNMTALVVSAFGTLYSYFGGAYNPIIIALSYLSEKFGNNNIIFPKTYHQFFTEFNKHDFFSIESYTLFVMGMITMLMLYATFSCIIYVSLKLTSAIERFYIKCRFGGHYLRVYNRYSLDNHRKLEKMEKKKNEKDDLECAAYGHYEKWKEYYKSDLSFKDWQLKVMGVHSDNEAGK
ncbi:hypothetical protein H8C17_002582 [Salmonella enterica]|nr:hypothetical protein [Salmonella enterica]